MTPGVRLRGAADVCIVEALRGRRAHGDRDFASLHEGLAVLREEYLELERAVFRDRPIAEVREEASHVGAMALRILAEFPESAFCRTRTREDAPCWSRGCLDDKAADHEG